MRALACAAALAVGAQAIHGLPMLGPGQYGHRQGGLTLVQTRQEPVVNSNAVATPD